MSKKSIIIIRTVAGVVAFGVCVCFSVYFENLTGHRAELAGQTFSPGQMLDRFWDEDLGRLLEEAVDLETFQSLLVSDPRELIDRHGKTLGIGAPCSFIVRGEGRLGQAGDESVELLRPSGRFRYRIQTAFIFGNTVREASGCFDIDEFENTMDFNAISAGINDRIVSDIVGPVKERLEPGTGIAFYGAVDLYPGKLQQTEFDIVPLKIEFPPHE